MRNVKRWQNKQNFLELLLLKNILYNLFMLAQEKSVILDKIFKDPGIRFGLNEFKDLDIEKILDFDSSNTARLTLACIKRKIPLTILTPSKSAPEEIIRQLMLYKLVHHYGYPLDRIDVEVDVQFGREIHTKAADIVVYQEDKITPWIIVETKKHDQEEGIDQLKTYLNAKGSPIGYWTNGINRIILYRPYPKEFDDTLTDLPKNSETIEDVLKKKITLSDLEKDYNLKSIIQILEELVLAGSGEDVFQETFKLIYSKLYDEKEARNRVDQECLFKKSRSPQTTYERINSLFKEAVDQWPGIFERSDKIKLHPEHLSVCIGEMERIKMLDANMKIFDDAFEYLLPDVAKSNKGQYFTPRHVIDMAVAMLNPRKREYAIDTVAGSGGFLIHAMQWVWNHDLKSADHSAKIEYASRFLYGIDFDDKSTKISRALMLIAGDGKSHIFKADSLDSRKWTEEVRVAFKSFLMEQESYEKTLENEKKYRFFNFDVVLTNPPFAGEIREQNLIRFYNLPKLKNGKYPSRVERDMLFIERNLDFLKPGGRIAIVLPQGKLNNQQTSYIRKYLLNKARVLAVVGLDVNTFRLPAPAKGTSTKTSIIFLQKWNDNAEVGPLCPFMEKYPIFMAVSEKSGKNNSGEYVWKKDEKGSYLVDDEGNRIVDHDLDGITTAFQEFAVKENFSFVK
jgi:type I restriction enzyme M protein